MSEHAKTSALNVQIFTATSATSCHKWRIRGAANATNATTPFRGVADVARQWRGTSSYLQIFTNR